MMEEMNDRYTAEQNMMIQVNLNRLCEILDIPKPRLFFPDEKDIEMEAWTTPSENMICLNRNLPFELNLIFALAHECRHLWQIKNRKADIDKHEDTNKRVGDENYNSQESEMDANAFAGAYFWYVGRIEPLWLTFSDKMGKELNRRIRVDLKPLFLSKGYTDDESVVFQK